MARDVAKVDTGTIDPADVFLVRGARVMLDSQIAAAFGLETKRVNEAVQRNPAKFDDRHTFQLSAGEWTALRSQLATSKEGRGGTRYAPHVFTVKGVARLATVLDTPAALAATDLIIDTFLMVQEQMRRGRRTVAVPAPERYRPSEEHRGQLARLRTRLANAVEKLLDTMVDAEGSQSIGQVSQAIGAKALANIQERLRSKGLENAKLEADASLVLAQAEKVLAEARKARAEADGLDIDNFEKRVTAVRKVADLIRELEPPEVIDLIEDFDAEPVLISPSSKAGSSGS